MTNKQHPIVPSEELKEEWESEWHHYRGQDTYEEFMARQAAQWGADQELERCRKWVSFYHGSSQAERLRIARRPKPPSLKEQALEALDRMDQLPTAENFALIREALEALPND